MVSLVAGAGYNVVVPDAATTTTTTTTPGNSFTGGLTYVLTDEQFLAGYSKELAVKDRFKVTVDAELQAKLPAAMEGSGYILHSDHSIPNQVDYETYKFFLETGREVGRYK